MVRHEDIFNVIKYKNGDFYYGQVKLKEESERKLPSKLS